MPHPIEPSTFRILKPNGKTIGTGFLVAPNLAVTCVHVVAAGLDADGRVAVQFSGQKRETTAIWLDKYFISGADVAILQMETVPSGVSPLRLAHSSTSRAWNKLYSFGYASTAGQTGLGSLGTFVTQKTGGNYIQFDSPQVDHGFSGAPLFDENLKVVIGMINMGNDELGRNQNTTFAIPTETIWQVCPQLTPKTPVLPRRNPIVEGINLLPYDYDQRIQNFLGEYLGNEQHPVPFGGRDDALKTLDGWLATPTPYLLLAAPAGRGKSALLVRWLDSLSSREDLALAFVPVSIRFGTNMERVFYAALAARLAYLYGGESEVPTDSNTSAAVYRGLVSDYLSKPLANGRTLLVVLDGLDEAADWQAGADFMPSELPVGVRVVVSARFLAGDADSTPWLRRLNWERNGLASAPSLARLDRAGVADVLLKMGCPLDELSRKVDIVAELYRLSEGDPLLVSLYVSDLWAKGAEVTRLKPENLAGIQPGYKGYFDRWWDDQKKLWGKEKPWLEKHIWTVLNLLAGALGPLFAGDMQALAPELASNYIADALDVLQRFIIGDNQSQGYTFSHPKLGQYFWEALTQPEQSQMEGRFLTRSEQTLQEFIDGKRDPKKKVEVPAYVVRNYGAHLTRAGRPIEKWLPLIHHQQWAQAWFTVEGAYGGYLQDVQRVLDQCKALDRKTIEGGGNAPYFGAQVRCALIEASLHSLAVSIPAELIPVLVQAGLWTLPQAWVVIRQSPESHQQAEAIIGLLPQLEDRQLPEALVAARTIKDQWSHARVLSTLTERLPELAREALSAAWAIEDEWSRAHMLIELAQRLPEGKLGLVLEAARAIGDEGDRARVLSALAQHLLEGELGQVLAAASAIQNEWYRVNVLSELAQRLPKGELGLVLEAARAIRSEYPRANMLNTLAQRLPEEKLGEVLEMARAIQDEGARVNVLNNLAQRLPEGDLDERERARVSILLAQHLLNTEALQVAQTIVDKASRATMLRRLAQHLPSAAQKAIQVLRPIFQSGYHANVLSDLSQRLQKGDLMQVLEAVRAIETWEDRANVLNQAFFFHVVLLSKALSLLSKALNRIGILGQALSLRLPSAEAEALTEVLRIETGKERANTLITLIERLPEGELGKVLERTRAIRIEEYRVKVLVRLAQRLPDVAEEALKAAQVIGDLRPWVLRDLEQYLPEGPFGRVLAIVRAIQDKWWHTRVSKGLYWFSHAEVGNWLVVARAEGFRANVLSQLVQYLPEWTLEHALTRVRMIQSESDRASMLIALAKRIPDVVEEALAATRAIQSKDDRAIMLISLAQRMPKVTEEALVHLGINEW